VAQIRLARHADGLSILTLTRSRLGRNPAAAETTTCLRRKRALWLSVMPRIDLQVAEVIHELPKVRGTRQDFQANRERAFEKTGSAG